MTKEEIRERLGLMTPEDFLQKKVLPAREHIRNSLGREHYEEVVSSGMGTGRTTEMLLSAAEFLTTKENDNQDVVIAAHTLAYASRLAGDLRQMLQRLGRSDAGTRVVARSFQLRADRHHPDWKKVWFRDHYYHSPRLGPHVEKPTTAEAP